MAAEHLYIINWILAAAVPIVLIGGLTNRLSKTRDGWKFKGIGWQFIRYTVIAIALPMVTLLALNDALSGEAIALFGTAMGFAFGKVEDENKKPEIGNGQN